MDRSQAELDALATAARQLQSAASNDELLQRIVDMAVLSLAGCDYAGVSVDRDGRPQSPTVSDPQVLAIDSLQYSIATGPCLQAMRGSDVLVDVPDLEHDQRFVPFGEEAAKAGCRAALAHRLYVDSQTLGSLNLYASKRDAFTDDDRTLSVILSALASMALNMTRLEIDGDGLREAVFSRDVIGQAKGILMEREHLSADKAFARLNQQSQDQNVKLRDVAQQLVNESEPGRS
jgi:GAF domain-containing protein